MGQLPSTACLLAFEAVARHLSFKRAALELNITQGAVSQRIRTLEDLLSQSLFVREGNAIYLSQWGMEYISSIRPLLRQMMGATDRIVQRELGSTLTIGCFNAFALNCLMPRIGSFVAANPDLSIRLRTPLPFEDAHDGNYDISIRYGFKARWPGMNVTKLGNEEIFPVCSPGLLHGNPGLRSISDLAKHTVIRTSSPLLYQDEWPLWLEQGGLAKLSFAGELNCDFLYPSYRAAVAGLGIAMGRTAVVRDDIASGLLVEPFAIRVRSPLGYHLVVSPERMNLPKVRRFYDWAILRLCSDLPPS